MEKICMCMRIHLYMQVCYGVGANIAGQYILMLRSDMICVYNSSIQTDDDPAQIYYLKEKVLLLDDVKKPRAPGTWTGNNAFISTCICLSICTVTCIGAVSMNKRRYVCQRWCRCRCRYAYIRVWIRATFFFYLIKPRCDSSPAKSEVFRWFYCFIMAFSD